MFTVNKGNLRLSAQFPPLGDDDQLEATLEFKDEGAWKPIETTAIDTPAYLAVFDVPKIDNDKAISYRINYNGSFYDGVIPSEPKENLTMGALTCQEWTGYPYSPLVEQLYQLDPDMLYFSGDQLYEYNGGYPIRRQDEELSILSYLGKWYMFGWTFGDLMRNRPTVCTPDDHDVFQGNLWGDGGKRLSFEEWKTKGDAWCGYVQTPKMVNSVYKIQTSHHPLPYNPTLIQHH